MINEDLFANLVLSSGSYSHKKLQKLCYYVYAWYLAIHREKIAKINFEAWVHGPVSPELYQKYKKYGWDNIPVYRGTVPVNDSIKKFVSSIISKYDKYNAEQLEEMSHNELPWLKARKGHVPHESSNNLIDDVDIINYYSEKAHEEHWIW